MWSNKSILIALCAGIVAACACNKSAAKGTQTPQPAGPSPSASSPNSANPAPKALPDVPAAATVQQRKAALLSDRPIQEKLGAYLAGTPLRAAFEAKRWQECSNLARSWLAEHAKSPKTRPAAIIGALCDEHAGHSAVAAEEYDRLAAAGGVIAEALHLRAAESWLVAGEADKALAALAKIDVTRFARASRAAEIEGLAYRQKQDAAKSFAAFSRAVRGLQGGAALLMDAAQAAGDAGKSSEQARLLRAIMARYPATSFESAAQARLAEIGGDLAKLNAGELLLRAESARRRHKRKLAIATADELMANEKPGSRPWCDAGVVKARALETWWPKRKQAAALYDRLAKTCPMQEWTAKLRYRAAKRQMNTASKTRAIALFDEVAKVAPTSTLIDDAMRYQARMLRELNQSAKADRTLEKILTLKGDMVEYAGWDLLWQAVQKKRWKHCIATGKRVIAAAPTSAKRYNAERARYWTAFCAMKAGQRKAAIAGFSEVVKNAPVAWYGMLAAQRLKQLGKASRPAKKAANLGQEQDLLQQTPRLSDDPHFLAGIELLRLGMKTSAAAELRAVAWNKKSAAESMVQALLHAAVGDYTRATAIANRDRHFDGPSRDVTDAPQRWQLAYPRPGDYLPHVEKQAKTYNVDPMFVWAIMRSESRFNRRATSPVLATGLLQLMPGTAKTVAKRLKIPPPKARTDLMVPALNIHLGTAYMRRLLDISDGHYALVASGYNAGPGNTRKWKKRWPGAELDEFVERIPFRENRRYVKSVVTSWLRYNALYADGRRPSLAWKVTSAGSSRRARANRRR